MKHFFSAIVFAFSCTVVCAQDVPQEVKKRFHVMDSLWEQDDLTGVIQYAKKEADFFKENNGIPYYSNYVFLIDYLGKALKENGQYDEAEATLLQTLEMIAAAKLKAHPSYADALYELGNMYAESGRFTKAYNYYTQAWPAFDFLKPVRPGLYIRLANNLITVCASTGKYDKAEYYANKIEAAMPKLNFSNEDLAEFNLSLAILYGQMLAMEKAEIYLDRTSKLLGTAQGSYLMKVQLQNSYSATLMSTGYKDSAENILLQLKRELEEQNMQNTDYYYMTISNLASVYTVNNKGTHAETLLTNTINRLGGIRSKHGGLLFGSLALIQMRPQKYEQSLANIDTAIAVFDIYAKDDWQYSFYLKMLKSVILLKLSKPEMAYETYNAGIGGYTNHINENISHLSEMEKNGLMLGYFNTANFVQSFLLPSVIKNNPGLVKKTWQQHLFYKGLAGTKQGGLYETLSHSPDTLLQARAEEWLELKRFIQAELQKPVIIRNKNIDSVLLLAEEKEKQLMLYLPPAAKAQPNATIESIYNSLQPGEAVIDFCHYSRITVSAARDSLWYGAFVLRYGHPDPEFVNICNEEALSALLNGSTATAKGNKLINQLYPPDFLSTSQLPGSRLYRLIWKPLQKLLSGINTVYISADGEMHKVAFHVLPVESGGYLFDRLNVRYLYQCGNISDSSFRLGTKPSGVQLWGGVAYDTTGRSGNGLKMPGISKVAVKPPRESSWNYLPGTKQEIDALEKLCAAQKIPVQSFSGKQATEATFIKHFGNSADYLHIATHGKFDTANAYKKTAYTEDPVMPFTLKKDPMKQVALVLAGRNNFSDSFSVNPPPYDGLLTAREITQIKTGAKQLVVLSACESGRGDIISAEGVYGMSRAFKMLGTKRIIISLWSIPDAQTKEMMIVFYKNLFAGGTVSGAFKKAQSYMRSKYPPFYWGGMLLVE